MDAWPKQLMEFASDLSGGNAEVLAATAQRAVETDSIQREIHLQDLFSIVGSTGWHTCNCCRSSALDQPYQHHDLGIGCDGGSPPHKTGALFS
jgi:hypothetical protein